MGKCVSLITLSVLLLGGCSSTSNHGVKPEPVSFNHPDEVIKGEGFMVLADRRMFAVLALLNATGYDEEAEGQQMHPVRAKVRQLVAAELDRHPHKARKWRKYVQSRQVAVFQYEDFVLSLSSDYPFRRIRPDSEIGYSWAVQRLQDFPSVLNDFWKTCKLGEVWEQVRPDYIAEIGKYDFEKMTRQMDFLWSYLRMPRQDTMTLVNVPDLLNRYFHAIGAGYENYYYTVESPGSHGYALNMHEYLHSIVNRLVQANFDAQKAKMLQYYQAGKDGPFCKTYRNPVTFTFECLVHALDRRISVRFVNDPKWTALREGQVAHVTNGGLNLTQPFYNLLAEYEKSGEPFDEFLPAMLEQLPPYTR